MAERWGRKDERYRALFKEVDDVLAHAKSPKLKAEAVFIKARAKVKETRPNGSPDLAPLEEFLKLSPRDPRGADLLQSAIDHTHDATARSSLQGRLTKDYPDSTYAAMLRGPREPKDWIGKPFDLEFADAITGAPVSIKKLKGKVVVVDFWATWCGPCVAEMPKMKELYARYSGQGVEFIGVSLDQPADEGGLQKLVSFVQENGIAWPQYYQGNGWKSGFSSSWKINSIPRVFVVDPQGKLYSVDARGKLETIIPQLLKARLASSPSRTETVGG
jgi:thiol-disulfide isomerase/thioredoxin